MSKRKRGERNWVDESSVCILHDVPLTSDDLEQSFKLETDDVVELNGRQFIKSVDGRLVPLDDE